MVILLIHLVDREHSGHFLDGQRHLFCLATGDLLAMLHENILPTARNPRSLRKLMCVHTLVWSERRPQSLKPLSILSSLWNTYTKSPLCKLSCRPSVIYAASAVPVLDFTASPGFSNKRE